MSDNKKIMLLVIDAGDRELIQNWAKEKTLPSIHSLMARGLVGDTVSVVGLYEGSTWPCFYTGVNPARHGFHRLTQIDPGTYDFNRCLPGEFIKREPFWSYLSRAGKKIAVLDIPLSWITEGINGIQTVEWGSHDGIYGFKAWPRELARDIIKRFGRHPLNKACDASRRSAADYCRFRDQLLEGVNRKAALTLHYLKQGSWDFFAQVFTEGHCAGHQCWHLHDPAHPNYDPAMVSQTGDLVREVYMAIDSAIGKILREADENTTVFLLATHRMAHNYGASFMLEDILEKLGFLKKQPAGNPREKPGLAGQIYGKLKGIWAQSPLWTRAALRPFIRPVYSLARRCTNQDRAPSISSRLDLANSKCFPHENGTSVSGIRINRVGREPCGIIGEGKEYEKFCEELSSSLLNIVDEQSGKPVIKNVYRTAELFDGEYLSHLPDLLVEWNNEIKTGSKDVKDDSFCRVKMVSDRLGTLEGDYTYCRTGDHRPEGLFVAAGPGIKTGRMERTVSLMDFAPTFLSFLGVEIPDFDGKPINLKHEHASNI